MPSSRPVPQNRPDFVDSTFEYTKPPNNDWAPGSGANSREWQQYSKIEIDPFGNDRSVEANYKLIIDGVTPRPIGLISTVSKEGHKNLAPFSFFNIVASDPPLFSIGISDRSGLKDTADNILATGELTINIISEWFAEAANYTAIDSPKGVSEWELSGLTAAKSTKVAPPHVAESIFSIEAKLYAQHHIPSRSDPSKHSSLVILVEGVNFHVREDAINKDQNHIDINKLKPVSRLGGISYAISTTGFEILRPEYN